MPFEGIPETIGAGPITLQRWAAEHADDLDRAINESLPELTMFLPWATADHDHEATTTFLAQSRSDWDTGESFNYAMFMTQGAVVGGIGLMSRRGPGVFEIGYWVHSSQAGKGYATAATLALTEVGLCQPGIDRVEIYHDVANRASGRVAAKAGFHERGPVERDGKSPGDTGTDLVWERNRGTAHG
jgi:ribosomal-protein-serine acetyltransferase